MDVERGARQRRDGEEWVERLERNLVQLSGDSTIARTNINKVGDANGVKF